MKIIKLISLLYLFTIIGCNSGSSKKEVVESQENEPVDTVAKSIDYPESLAKSFDAHGGLESWNSFGTMEYDLVRGESKERHVIDLKNRKVLLTSDNYTIGFDGQEVWISPNKEAMAGGSARFYHNLFFYFFSLPLILSDPGINYEDTGVKEFGDKEYNTVKISYEDGIGDSPEDFYIPFFDKESNQMEALLYTVTFNSGEATENYNALVYDQWQEVNGLVLPASMKGYKYENGEIGDLRYAAGFENVVLKEERPDQSIFEMPQEAEIDSLVVN